MGQALGCVWARAPVFLHHAPLVISGFGYLADSPWNQYSQDVSILAAWFSDSLSALLVVWEVETALPVEFPPAIYLDGKGILRMSKGKITILKRMVNQDLIDQYQHQTIAPCDIFSDGQEFLIEKWDTHPHGFCEWAWDDIKKKFELAKRLGRVVVCCTDGFRPVVFEIELSE